MRIEDNAEIPGSLLDFLGDESDAHTSSLGERSEGIECETGGRGGTLISYRYDAAHFHVPVYGIAWGGFLADGPVLVLYFCSADRLLEHPNTGVNILSTIEFLLPESRFALEAPIVPELYIAPSTVTASRSGHGRPKTPKR